MPDLRHQDVQDSQELKLAQQSARLSPRVGIPPLRDVTVNMLVEHEPDVQQGEVVAIGIRVPVVVTGLRRK